MSVGSIDVNSLSISLFDQTSTQAIGASVTTFAQGAYGTGSSSEASGSASSVEVSQQAQLFSKLQSLATSDPEKFKALMKDAADKLTAAANSADNDQSKQFLTDLASKFQKAADTGDPSSIVPKHGHHHHHGDASAQGASQTGQSSGAASAYGKLSIQQQSDGPDSTTRDAIKSVFDALAAAVSS